MGATVADEAAAPAGGDHKKQAATTARIPTQLPIHLLIIPQPPRS
jgi:hypothetical protein